MRPAEKLRRASANIERLPFRGAPVDILQAALRALRRAVTPRCGARTRSGAPCQAAGIGRGNRCKNHGGMSTGARTPEGKAKAREMGRRFQRAAVLCRFRPEEGRRLLAELRRS